MAEYHFSGSILIVRVPAVIVSDDSDLEPVFELKTLGALNSGALDHNQQPDSDISEGQGLQFLPWSVIITQFV